jgi:hypothetical protein
MENDPLDLTAYTDETLGDLCLRARDNSGEALRAVAADIGVSHVTLLAWERRSDPRLVAYWRGRGYLFPAPENVVQTRTWRIGKDRVLPLGHPIVDHGVVAEWSGMKFRLTWTNQLDEHEYGVNETTGTYRFSQKLHGRRSVIVMFKRAPVIWHKRPEN